MIKWQAYEPSLWGTHALPKVPTLVLDFNQNQSPWMKIFTSVTDLKSIFPIQYQNFASFEIVGFMVDNEKALADKQISFP